MLEEGRHLRWMTKTPAGVTSTAAAMAAVIEKQYRLRSHAALPRQLVPRDAVAAGCRCLAATVADGG